MRPSVRLPILRKGRRRQRQRGSGQTKKAPRRKNASEQSGAGGIRTHTPLRAPAFEQTLAVEVPENPVAHGVLELVPIGVREVSGLVELEVRVQK